MTIKSIKFTLNKGGEAGDHTLALKSFYSHYPDIQQTIPGDVNSDGEINIADVNSVIDIILKGTGGTPADDVNGDGEVNIADVNALIALILGT